jgi:hypothetical protein
MVALIALAGCGSEQANMPGLGAPAAKGKIKTQSLKSALSGTLVYASDASSVYVLSYPKGSLVQTLTGFNDAQNICSDADGNVWIPESNNQSGYEGTVVEYAHGGASSIATLNESHYPESCAVDSTGNLAVANQDGTVAIFHGAKGVPKYYPYGELSDLYSASFDSKGDLFLTGYIATYQVGTEWLQKGHSTLDSFTLHPHMYPHGGLAWDGKYLVVTAHPTSINRYSIIGGQGTKVGSLSLGVCCMGHFAIHGSAMAITDSGYYRVQYFAYPDGGAPTKTITVNHPNGIAISVAPKH